MLIERRKKIRSVIPLPSMADIAFILLIFFLLTSTMDIEREISIDLPNTWVNLSESKKYFTIWIDKEEKIFLKGKQADHEDLYKTAKYRSIDNPDVKALLGADKQLPFKSIHSIMEILQDAGVHNIVLISRKKIQR